MSGVGIPVYSLRPVVSGDWEFWRNLHHVAQRETLVRQFGAFDEVLQDGFALAEFQDTEGERSIVAIDGQDAGYWHVKRKGEDYYLVLVILHPAYQKKGVGKALLEGLMRRAAAENRGVVLQTLLENTARSFYEKLGFTVTGKGERHWQMRWSAGNKLPR